ncbi:MAG: hypothetical protein HC804_02865, partial [Anaerolineae bacterium]|nr:hypothetical protein [Anaerolineae bacterium]
PYDNADVRWALLLAIDIAEYMGVAVDGAGTLSPVHIPSLGSYPTDFIAPMEEWLTAFELDLGNGETFAPYDPDAPQRIVEYAQSRGYVVPEDMAAQDQAFGLGWYKFAPEAAEQLLIKNGFSRDAEGMWLLPDGTPWTLECMSGPQVATDLQARNCIAAVQQWRQFGIDASHFTTESMADLVRVGEFDVSGSWPGWSHGVLALTYTAHLTAGILLTSFRLVRIIKVTNRAGAVQRWMLLLRNCARPIPPTLKQRSLWALKVSRKL